MCFRIRKLIPFHLATLILPIQNHKNPKNAINACANTQIFSTAWQPSEVLLRHCCLCCKYFAMAPQTESVFAGTVIPFQNWKWAENSVIHSSKQEQCLCVIDCDISLIIPLGRAHSAIHANGGYLEIWILSPLVENCTHRWNTTVFEKNFVKNFICTIRNWTAWT